MTCRCPTCGSTVANPLKVLEGLAEAILGPVERDIVIALARAYPRRLSRRELTDFVYRDHIDGGPVRAENCISVARKRANAKIEPFGWTIPQARPGQGSEGFALVPYDPN